MLLTANLNSSANENVAQQKLQLIYTSQRRYCGSHSPLGIPLHLQTKIQGICYACILLLMPSTSWAQDPLLHHRLTGTFKQYCIWFHAVLRKKKVSSFIKIQSFLLISPSPKLYYNKYLYIIPYQSKCNWELPIYWWIVVKYKRSSGSLISEWHTILQPGNNITYLLIIQFHFHKCYVINSDTIF